MGEDQKGAGPLPDSIYRLDDVTLERVSLLYPEEMREPFLWLGWFVRERCRRELDALMLRTKAVGLTFDKTNWSKILRGKWNRDKENRELPSPIIALPKFLSAVKRLRDDERIKEMAGTIPFVETPTWTLIKSFIDVRRAPDRVNKFGIIVGFTGSQKTACFKEYVRRNNHGLCVWLEAPENGSRTEFLMWLANKYGAGMADSYAVLRRKVLESITERKTIIVDNAQKLYSAKHGNQQPIFDFLRRIQDETGCTVILSITPEFHKTLLQQMIGQYFEQFEGRAGGTRGFLVLPDYPTEEDVLAIAEAFGLVDAAKHSKYLCKLAGERGRIRILFEELQTAKIECEANGVKLTITALKANREEEAA